MLHDIAWRAMQVHGALGTTNEMPFMGMVHGAAVTEAVVRSAASGNVEKVA